MKRVICILSMALSICCTNPYYEPNTDGTIYGVVTDSNAELVRGAGVSLFAWENKGARIGKSLLLTTVTYDDGHFEFNEIEAGVYTLEVSSEGYQSLESDVTVRSGKTTKIDLKMNPIKTHLTVITSAPIINGGSVLFEGELKYENYVGNPYYPDEWGFVYSDKSKPTIHNNVVKSSNKESTGFLSFSFTAECNSLPKGTYHVRAYAKNKEGVEYGEDRTFKID